MVTIRSNIYHWIGKLAFTYKKKLKKQTLSLLNDTPKTASFLKITPGIKTSSINLNNYVSTNYSFRSHRKVFFVSNAGLCNLKCPYCITSRPAIQSHLNKDDFSFLFNYFGENIYFLFSGLGDFFCGYSEKDQLLRFLLKHDIKINLDINGIDIKELGDHDLEGKEKIDMIDISYHYGTMKKQKLINRWLDSVQKIHENNYNYYIKIVVSPLEKDILEEALLFYKKEVFPMIQKKLFLIPDVLVPNIQKEVETIADIHKETVDTLLKVGFSKENNFPSGITPPCPAGSRYFRIFYSGDIVPCEHLALNVNIKLGNIRKREVRTFKSDVNCNYFGFCDCWWTSFHRFQLYNLKKMPYPRRILYEFESSVQKLQTDITKETNNIKCSIDKILQDNDVLKNHIIEGWAFLNNTSIEGSKTYIILKSDKKSYIISTATKKRPDIKARFKDNEFNLDDSGFLAFIPYGTLEQGKYKIGIYIQKSTLEAFQFTDSVLVIK